MKTSAEIDAWLVGWTRALLPFAVQAWLNKWRREKRRLKEVRRVAFEGFEVVPLGGDRIIRQTKGSGEVFNALAMALAGASLLPGGITAFGLHFETPPSFLWRRS